MKNLPKLILIFTIGLATSHAIADASFITPPNLAPKNEAHPGSEINGAGSLDHNIKNHHPAQPQTPPPNNNCVGNICPNPSAPNIITP